MADGRGWFVSPQGTILKVPDRHILMVVREPEKFGMKKSEIEKFFNEHGEPVGLEGQARKIILRQVLRNGWIRIREQVGRNGYVAVELSGWTETAARSLSRWARTVLKDNKALGFDPHAQVRIAALEEKFFLAIPLSDLAKGGAAINK